LFGFINYPLLSTNLNNAGPVLAPIRIPAK